MSAADPANDRLAHRVDDLQDHILGPNNAPITVPPRDHAPVEDDAPYSTRLLAERRA